MIEVLPIEGNKLKELFSQHNIEFDEQSCFGYSAHEAGKDTGVILMQAFKERYESRIVYIQMNDKSDLWLMDGFTRACATQAFNKGFIKIVYDIDVNDEYSASMKQLGYKQDGSRLVIFLADLVHSCDGCSKAH